MPSTEREPERRSASRPTEPAPDHEAGVGPTDALSLRASVGALVRLLFSSPDNGRTMLALERTATLRTVEGRPEVQVVAKPFGGGIRIVDPLALRRAIGAFHYDSERSRREGDFRLQIRLDSWEAVKRVCRDHAQEGVGRILDTSPHRELREELGDALGVSLERSQYRLRSAGMHVEDTPRQTRSVRAPGQPTLRVYYVFEAWLEAPEIVASILESDRTSDHDLRAAALRDAEHGGRGRANAALAVELDDLRSTYLAMPEDPRGEPVSIGGRTLAGNVAVILGGEGHGP